MTYTPVIDTLQTRLCYDKKLSQKKERIKSKYTKNGQFNMTYEEYIAQEDLAREEEQADDQCFLTNQPEGQFVRGH